MADAESPSPENTGYVETPSVTPLATMAMQPTSSLSGRSLQMRQWGMAGAVLGYLGLYAITPHLPITSIYPILALTLLSLVLLLAFTVCLAQSLTTNRAIGINLGLAAVMAVPAIAIPLYGALFAHWRTPQDVPGWVLHYSDLLRSVPGLKGLLLIWLAASGGTAISRLVREFNMLLPMAVVLACVDLFVVFGPGPVSAATSGRSPLAKTAMNALTVQLPTVQPKTGATPFPVAAGFADFLFIALFFACFARFRIPSRETFVILCAVLCVYMLIVFQFALALPALVPIAVVVIGMNLRAFHYKREEAFALLYAGIIVAVVGTILFFALRR